MNKDHIDSLQSLWPLVINNWEVFAKTLKDRKMVVQTAFLHQSANDSLANLRSYLRNRWQVWQNLILFVGTVVVITLVLSVWWNHANIDGRIVTGLFAAVTITLITATVKPLFIVFSDRPDKVRRTHLEEHCGSISLLVGLVNMPTDQKSDPTNPAAWCQEMCTRAREALDQRRVTELDLTTQRITEGLTHLAMLVRLEELREQTVGGHTYAHIWLGILKACQMAAFNMELRTSRLADLFDAADEKLRLQTAALPVKYEEPVAVT